MRNKYVDAVNELLADNVNAWKLPHEHHAIRYWLETPEYYRRSYDVLKLTNDYLIRHIKLDKGENMQIANPLEIFQK